VHEKVSWEARRERRSGRIWGGRRKKGSEGFLPLRKKVALASSPRADMASRSYWREASSKVANHLISLAREVFNKEKKKSAYDVGSVIKRQRKRARDGAVVDDLGRRGTRLERGGRRDGGGEGEGGEEGGGEHAGAVIEDCRVRVGKGRCCWLMRRVVTWQEDVLYAARDDADD
jgi:hypothetical protein